MGYNSNKIDVNDSGYVSGNVTVGTSAVEAKVGAGPLAGREMVRLYNKSTSVVYFGPAGVTTSTGEPLQVGQSVSIPAGPNNAVFMIRASGSGTILVQEMA